MPVSVEKLLRDAGAEGAFRELPGAGKPFEWTTMSDHEDWLVNHMLAGAGYAPDWIERCKEIRSGLEALRSAIGCYVRAAGRVAGVPDPQAARRLGALRTMTAQLNRAIDRANLVIPVHSATLARVDLEAEIRTAERALQADDHDASGRGSDT